MGILSQHVGVFSMQNMLALQQNGDVHRQFREQNPLEMFVERGANNNELEQFFSQVAINGYKPRFMELQVRKSALRYPLHLRLSSTRSPHSSHCLFSLATGAHV